MLPEFLRTPPPRHRTTSRQLGGLYPFGMAGALPGILMGIDMDSGGVFNYDPWDIYKAQIVSGMIVMLIGKLGRRKSSYIKTHVYRSLAFDRRWTILDAKREYGPLCEAVGTEPLRLEPGGKTRLNPLDHRLLQRGNWTERQLFLEQLRTLRAMCEAAIGPGTTLTPAERGAVRVAFLTARENAATVREATIPDVMKELASPNDEQARHLGMPLRDLRQAARQPMLALQELVEGELSGMFDGPTSATVNFDHPLLVVDIRSVYKTPAQAVVMVCAGAWMQQLLLQRKGYQGWVVDECWALLDDLSTARWLLETTKFSRVFALSLWMVFHEFSDLGLTGEGSPQARIGRELMSHAQTKIIYCQDVTQIAETRDLLRLSDLECEVIARLLPGESLQRIGDQLRFRVEHRATDEEIAICETDDAMTEAEEDVVS